MQESSGEESATTSDSQVQPESVGFKKPTRIFPQALSIRFLLFSLVTAIIFLIITFALENAIGRKKITAQTLESKIFELNEGSFKDASSGGPLSNENLNQAFLEPLRKAHEYKSENKIAENFYKYTTYVSVYSKLVGQYYATRDPKILQAANSMREYLRVNFPKDYYIDEKADPKAWEITE